MIDFQSFGKVTGKHYFQRPKNKRSDSRYVTSTTKYGGGHIMDGNHFLEMYGSLTKILGKFNDAMHKDVLQDLFLPYCKKLKVATICFSMITSKRIQANSLGSDFCTKKIAFEMAIPKIRYESNRNSLEQFFSFIFFKESLEKMCLGL